MIKHTHTYIHRRRRRRNKRWWNTRRLASKKSPNFNIPPRDRGSQRPVSASPKKRERQSERGDMLRRIPFTRQIDGPDSPRWMRQFFFQISLHRRGRCSSATAAASPLSPVTLREATTRRPFVSIHPRARRMEAEQSSLYRRHTKPFESWEPFSPFAVLRLIVFSSPCLPAAALSVPFALSHLCLSLGTIIFTACSPGANNTVVRSRGLKMHRKWNSPKLAAAAAAVEDVTSALSRGLRKTSPQGIWRTIRRTMGLTWSKIQRNLRPRSQLG